MTACLFLFFRLFTWHCSLMEYLQYQSSIIGSRLRHRYGQQQSLDGQIREAAQEQEREDSVGRQPCDTLYD